MRLGKGSVDEAVRNYQAALAADLPGAEKIEVLARLIRLLGIEQNQPDKVAALLTQADQEFKAARATRELRDAYRRVLIAAGDVALWQGNLDAARGHYVRAEQVGDEIPAAVRAARVGAYPNSLREYIAARDYAAALDLVDRWEWTFPADKVKGHTFYWRGKVLALRGRPQDAELFLDRAVRLTVGAGFESEARWLLAETLEALGRKEEARKELAKLAASGLNDEFVRRARDKLMK